MSRESLKFQRKHLFSKNDLIPLTIPLLIWSLLPGAICGTSSLSRKSMFSLHPQDLVSCCLCCCFFCCFFFKLSSGICSHCPLFLWLLGSNFWESTWGCYDFYSLVIFFYWTIFSFVWGFCLCKRCFNCLSVFLSGSIIFIHYFRVVGVTRKASIRIILKLRIALA